MSKTKISTLESFLKKESSAGIILIFVTIAALIFKNTGLSELYDSFNNIPVEIRLGNFQIAKPLLLWVNDGLMAIFFFLIGIEVKREVIEGHLSTVSQAILPGVAAVGGMVVPALVYVIFNFGDSFAIHGWAIPTATDIAFALGVIALLGKRVPLSLKVFLLALAIIDDLGAIIIIALFYTADLSIISISIAAISIVVLIAMNRLNVTSKAAYILVGIVLWVSVLKSGVHATLAGVALAFIIPLSSKKKNGETFSMSKEMEHGLHYWVAFMILPLFAFVNAGVDIRGISMEEMIHPVPMGIMLGLFLGKQIGVFGFSWIAIKLGFASMPKDSNWQKLYGISILTGIGFTMSLFIGNLAFDQTDIYNQADKLAILVGSFISGIVGYLLIRGSKKIKNSESI